MLWDAGPHAAFCPAGVTPWLPVEADYHTRNVQAQLAEPRSMLNLTRRLLALRRASPALSHGDYQPLDDVPPDVFAYWRTAGDERLLVVLNFADEERVVTLPEAGMLQVLVSTRMDGDAPVAGNAVTLCDQEGCVLRAEA